MRDPTHAHTTYSYYLFWNFQTQIRAGAVEERAGKEGTLDNAMELNCRKNFEGSLFETASAPGKIQFKSLSLFPLGNDLSLPPEKYQL